MPQVHRLLLMHRMLINQSERIQTSISGITVVITSDTMATTMATDTTAIMTTLITMAMEDMAMGDMGTGMGTMDSTTISTTITAMATGSSMDMGGTAMATMRDQDNDKREFKT